MKRTVVVAAVTALATLSVSNAADKSKDIVRYENAGSTPVFTASIRVTLRTSSPAPNNRTTASATSTTTSPLRSVRPWALLPLPPSLSASCSAERDMMSAGTSPNASAVTAATAVAIEGRGGSEPATRP